MVQSAPKPRKSGWSEERRARHAEAIRKWKPWTKATGPRTASGKARSARNAYKHGRRALSRRLLNQAFAAQGACVRLALHIHSLRKHNPSNELLRRLRSRLHRLGHIFDVRLYQAIYDERLCKNLAFPDPLRQIVNANDN